MVRPGRRRCAGALAWISRPIHGGQPRERATGGCIRPEDPLHQGAVALHGEIDPRALSQISSALDVQGHTKRRLGRPRRRRCIVIGEPRPEGGSRKPAADGVGSDIDWTAGTGTDRRHPDLRPPAPSIDIRRRARRRTPEPEPGPVCAGPGVCGSRGAGEDFKRNETPATRCS